MGAQTVIMDALPQVQGMDDSVVIFRSRLLRLEEDGPELRVIFDRMFVRHPQVAAQVVAAGSLGEVMWSRAVASLEIFRDTQVAQAPLGM